ncbi:hypothetical protein A3A76_04800 [Candidatus Woesebacteria bacterium RIFCSPLOWO2_01_FULL_39_23]|nr:MAG: hypothetical protein A2141_04025 [Candidatus Woesebacteria bacterium RBG_16_40_11]OGM27872.1 MAG: hypothetical protein A2628_05020 [Candidatus Woesebacteria bacterium RIFCSPHIGHO2_01_FULL_40_22]OGM36028.1 MAG: hypothetical protein A3E41_01275 [Candidatus Woesebacteria bacterium RIFCSPHIGHO2_12_FULL_38_9]OGM62294.1 MAG: hypothetical protein A3A76_04800 [Candidatus Woesebacteria bacterium RIFCSPLOWO2_01_FULL_39_23]
MIKHLKSAGYKVLPIEADEKAYLKLYKYRKKIDLVFNYSLGLNGRDRYCHIPAMCEMLEIPYTGSSPLTQATTMNKGRAKEILQANNVPTLPFQIFTSQDDKLKSTIDFPLIVKPVAQGSSAGITNKSVVNNREELDRQVAFILKTFNEPALVEPFLDGREFSVPMLGNPPKILPIIESDHSVLPKEYLPIDSLEVKWHFEETHEKNNLICPAKIDEQLKQKIERICYQTWEAQKIQDSCRIDIRCDSSGNPYVLEINSPAGMIPPDISKTSYFPFSAGVAGLSYEELLKEIISIAFKRYN